VEVRVLRDRGVAEDDAAWGRKPEVGDADAAVDADQHVGRLEVAVDEPDLVGREQPGASLEERRGDLPPAARARGQPLLEVDAVDVLHRQVHAAVVDPGLEHRDDVRVGEAGERLGLAQQLVGAVRGAGGVAEVDELDRDPAVELLVVAGVDHPHRAATELAQHREAGDLPQRRGRGGRGGRGGWFGGPRRAEGLGRGVGREGRRDPCLRVTRTSQFGPG
jgi:hypothetical protein